MARYRVVTADNFHYMEDAENTVSGVFEIYTEAVAACQAIVDRSLAWHHKPGMTADELYETYVDFGDDPFVVAIGDEPMGERFSAWTYAEQRCKTICAGEG
jgi:hypothetical protein